MIPLISTVASSKAESDDLITLIWPLIVVKRPQACFSNRTIWRIWCCLILTGFCSTLASADESGWWPTQTPPSGWVQTTKLETVPEPSRAYHALLESLSGLAARSVNDGTGDELVWITNGNRALENWRSQIAARHPDWEFRGEIDPWGLVDRYVQRGLIKGYILYRQDASRRRDFDWSREMDQSINVATSLAGVLDGILIEERLEEQAKAKGLALLADARHQSLSATWEQHRDRFHRRLLLCQDPLKPNCRELAIAQRAFALYGDDPTLPKVLEHLEPSSAILGWNGGDELKTTRLSSIHGHFQTATDWCMNLTILMADAATARVAKVPHADPRRIDWSDQRSAVSFVITDGDNVQWYEGDFFLTNKDFWDSPDRGKIPFGWSSCFSHLTQMAPVIIDHAVKSRTEADEFIEWGGGYYYPDVFGKSRPDRWQILSKHASRTWHMMQRNDTRIIGFNMIDVDSRDARKAYEVFAQATDGLLAIFAFQYAPYEGGAGKTFWVKDAKGIEIPVITARYSIWEHASNRRRAGTPAKVAREIRETVARADQPRYDWVISHAWSFFRKAEGPDEQAEEMSQSDARQQGGIRGLSPTTWCAERLPETIRVVGPEELVWRIRMQHDPETTRRLLEQMP